MTDRRLPADRSDRASRRSTRWLWLLILLVLLAVWHWFDRGTGEPAAAPPVEIDSPAEQAADVDRIDRPGREPRHLERSGPDRTGGDGEAGATPSEPPVPLTPGA